MYLILKSYSQLKIHHPTKITIEQATIIPPTFNKAIAITQTYLA